MITDKDLTISNKSYINKDFATIYEELINNSKAMSLKYDAETSNESDPFIMLLKNCAFIGDKFSYNIDQNVKQKYMPSVTQDSAMRDLCESYGYTPSYYKSAKTQVYFKYTGDEEFTSSHTSFIIPKFTKLVTSSGDINFITIEDCVISNKMFTSVGTTVLQGDLKTLTVLDSDVITLDNLDSNNRVYFPELMVAQNGIFIASVNSSDSWTEVDNLNLDSESKKIYKFGYDSVKGFPYIEFSSFISEIIDEGITINYVVTNGSTGNVSANSITTLVSPLSVNWSNDSENSVTLGTESESYLVVKNSNSAMNGRDPETINEAYNSYKLIQGTFDSLVSLRDYYNAIKQLKDVNDIDYLTSMAQVSDRRTDINYSKNIITFNESGQVTVSDTNSSNISANDLCIYALKPFVATNVAGFKDSFDVKTSINDITSSLEDIACVSHNYKTLSSDDIYYVKNYYGIEAKIVTQSTVTSFEAVQIKSNIENALIKNFNAEEIESGYEIPYDLLLSVIESADERIKSVSLFEPELTTVFLLKDNSEIELFQKDGQGIDLYLDIVAKNVLSGRISLYNTDDDFNYEFGQKKIENINSLTDDVSFAETHANITLNNNAVTLNANEVVQMISPNLITKVTYPYGVNYYLKLNTSTYIPQNTEYELKSGEVCIFEYTDSNDNQVIKVYSHTTDIPTIINPNIDLYTTAYRIENSERKISKVVKSLTDRNIIKSVDSTAIDSSNQINLYTLSTNDQVEYRTINQEKIDHNVYCYWIMNNSNNEIFWNENGEYILEAGEYFFHTDVGFNNLYSFGEGTLIKKTGFTGVDWSAETVSIEDLDTDGLSSYKNYFKYREITSENTITLVEQQIVTLMTDNKIKATYPYLLLEDEPSDWTTAYVNYYTRTGSGSESDPYVFTHISTSTAPIFAINTYYKDAVLTNDYLDCSDCGIQYTLDSSDNFSSLTNVSYTGGYWKIRERLDIISSSTEGQTLVGNQTIYFYNKDIDTEDYSHSDAVLSLSSGMTFELKYSKSVSGGDLIDLRELSLTSNSVTTLYETVYVYSNDTSTSATDLDVDKYEYLTINDDVTSKTYSIPKFTDRKVIVMLYPSTDTDTDTVSVSVDSSGSIKYCNGSSITNNKLISNKLNVIEITNSSTLVVSRSADSSFDGVVIISSISVVNGYNSLLGLQEFVDNGVYKPTTETTITYSELISLLLNKINSIDTNNLFYYNSKLNKDKLIECSEDYSLSSAYTFYDSNNIASKWTISEIDLGASAYNDAKVYTPIKLSIAKSSMK